MDSDLLDLLYNYFRRREAHRRRVEILQRVIAAQKRGEAITRSVLDEYASQLDSVTIEESDPLQIRH